MITPLGFTEITSEFEPLKESGVSSLANPRKISATIKDRPIQKPLDQQFLGGALNVEVKSQRSPTELFIQLKVRNKYEELVPNAQIRLEVLAPNLVLLNKFLTADNRGSLSYKLPLAAGLNNTDLEIRAYAQVNSQELDVTRIQSTGSTPSTELVYVPPLPLEELGVQAVEDNFESSFVSELLNVVSLASEVLSGSSGRAVFEALGIPDPFQIGLDTVLPNRAINHLQKSNSTLVELISNWATKLLNVHSKGLNSETTSLSLAFSTVKNIITEYETFIAEAGKHASTASKAMLADYAEGNNNKITTGVETIAADRMYLNSGNATSLSSPFLTERYTQKLSTGRFEHHNSDVWQSTHQHFTARAERMLGLMAGEILLYADASLRASAKDIEIKATDSCLVQASHIKIQSFPNLGTVGVPSLEDITDFGSLGAGIGDLTLAATKDTFLYSHAGRLSIYSFRGVEISSPRKFAVSSSAISLKALGLAKLDAGVVMINSGRSLGKLIPPAIPLDLSLPRKALPNLPKAPAPGPKPKVQTQEPLMPLPLELD